MKNSYDLIFSLGQACLCSQVLRACDLQQNSYPFDWLYGSSFIERIGMLTSGFDDFMQFENLKYLGNRLHPEPCDIYGNTKNGLVFNHDFPLDVPLLESYGEVNEKYQRRIKRLFKLMSKSKDVLIVYIENPNEKGVIKDDSILIEAQDKLKKAFPELNIDLLYASCNPEFSPNETRIENVNENITKLEADYRSLDINAPAHIGNCLLLEKGFSKIKLSTKRGVFLDIRQLKRGLGIYLFKNMFNILRLRFLVFGLRLDFCIGKIRD